MSVTRTEAEPQELVPVMVPRHLLSDVYGFIAERSTASGAVRPSGQLHRGWTAELIIEAYGQASDRMKALLDLMASRPDEKLFASDFLKELGAENPEFINGVLGAFGRLTNQRFSSRLPNRENTWPFSVSKDIREGRWCYTMPSSVADVIKSINR